MHQNVVRLCLPALVGVGVGELQSQFGVQVGQLLLDMVHQPFIACLSRSLHQGVPSVNGYLCTVRIVIHVFKICVGMVSPHVTF